MRKVGVVVYRIFLQSIESRSEGRSDVLNQIGVTQHIKQIWKADSATMKKLIFAIFLIFFHADAFVTQIAFTTRTHALQAPKASREGSPILSMAMERTYIMVRRASKESD